MPAVRCLVLAAFAEAATDAVEVDVVAIVVDVIALVEVFAALNAVESLANESLADFAVVARLFVRLAVVI